MHVTGKVVGKAVNEGPSSMTIDAEVDYSTPQASQPAVKVVLTMSSPTPDLIEQFKVGQSLSFTL